MYLRTRVYPGGQGPVWRPIPTQVPPKRRSPGNKNFHHYPWVESLFENRTLQPFIHDTLIMLHENGHDHHFHLFCQNRAQDFCRGMSERERARPCMSMHARA